MNRQICLYSAHQWQFLLVVIKAYTKSQRYNTIDPSYSKPYRIKTSRQDILFYLILKEKLMLGYSTPQTSPRFYTKFAHLQFIHINVHFIIKVCIFCEAMKEEIFPMDIKNVTIESIVIIEQLIPTVFHVDLNKTWTIIEEG